VRRWLGIFLPSDVIAYCQNNSKTETALPMNFESDRLDVNHLSCTKGDRILFSDIDFSLGSGEWLHVRGANGAGKTSLLRLLAGLSSPASGSIRWNGSDVAKGRQAYREALLYLGHPAGAKEELTPLENLRIAASIDGTQLDDRTALGALSRVGLRGREDLPLRSLSQGQKRRVLLSLLITRKARLWILDEPLTALDVRAIDLVSELVAEHVAAGGLAVLTSHQAIPIAGGRELTL
jgi:heme exporter protein A